MGTQSLEKLHTRIASNRLSSKSSITLDPFLSSYALSILSSTTADYNKFALVRYPSLPWLVTLSSSASTSSSKIISSSRFNAYLLPQHEQFSQTFIIAHCSRIMSNRIPNKKCANKAIASPFRLYKVQGSSGRALGWSLFDARALERALPFAEVIIPCVTQKLGKTQKTHLRMSPTAAVFG